MKHIVMFSGGAASSIVAELISNQYPNDTILLYTPTRAEHEDADRFREDVSNFIGIPITIESTKKSLWQRIESYKHIANHSIPWCTKEMKMIPQNRFLKRLEKTGEDFIIYVGMGADEKKRVQQVSFRNLELNRNVAFPLYELGLTSLDCKEIINREWGIKLPAAYQYLEHNNCIPCYKGGKNHFYLVWKYYPSQFWRAAVAEDRALNTVFKGVTLGELAYQWKRVKNIPILKEKFNVCVVNS